jgi:hypothetical protein
VNDDADLGTVFRGVRGELPEVFWLEDDFGNISATDQAFMSTSVDEAICKVRSCERGDMAVCCT